MLGMVDGKLFDWIVDVDLWFGLMIEVIINGCYGLLLFDVIGEFISEGLCDLCDFVWYFVEIILKVGLCIVVLLLVCYFGVFVDLVEVMVCVMFWCEDGIGVGQWFLVMFDGEDYGLFVVCLLWFDQGVLMVVKYCLILMIYDKFVVDFEILGFCDMSEEVLEISWEKFCYYLVFCFECFNEIVLCVMICCDFVWLFNMMNFEFLVDLELYLYVCDFVLNYGLIDLVGQMLNCCVVLVCVWEI